MGTGTLIEDKIDNLKHRRNTLRQVTTHRDFKRNPEGFEGPFGPNDPLSHRRLLNHERVRDLIGCKPT